MVTIITKNNSSSCNNSKKWLEEWGIEFEEVNVDIQKNQLTREILIKILILCNAGMSQIMKPQQKVSSTLDFLLHNFESLSFNTALNVLLEYPNLLVAPILFDDKKLQLGYDKEEIRKFIPSQKRE